MKSIVEFRIWKRNWIVMAAIIVHSSWATILLFGDAPLNTTPMGELKQWINGNRWIAAFIYGLASLIAAIPIFNRKLDTKLIGVICCVPQQILMMLSAFTALYCVMRGSYFDGVPRDWTFILADQLWGIVGMTMHTLSLIDWYHYSVESGWNMQLFLRERLQ